MFREYVLRSATYILERIQEKTDSFPTDQRELALHTLSYTFKLPDAWPLTRKLLLIIAPKMEQAGYGDEWSAYLESGIQQSQQLGDTQAEAELRFHLGELYQYQAKYDHAHTQLEASLAYFEQVGNPYHQAQALNRLAGVVRRQGKLEEATQVARRGLALSAESKREQAFSYLVLGLIAFDQRDSQKARHLFEKSIILSEATNNERLIGWGLTSLGMAQWGLQQYKEAITYYERAINLFERIQDPVHQAITRMNQGNAYLKFDRFSDALTSYLEAEPIFRQTQDLFHLAVVNNNKGMVYHKLQNWNQAEYAYRFSIEQWQDIGNIGSLVNVLDNLGLLYIELSMYDKAISTFQEALTWLAHIQNESNYKHLFSMVTANLDQAMRPCKS
jgi:tetratricopeptide (TPR) repeat protein